MIAVYLSVGANGAPVHIQLAQTCPSRELAEQAVAIVSRRRYTPQRVNGHPVPFRIPVVVRFNEQGVA